MRKERKPTEVLNVELAGIDALLLGLSMLENSDGLKRKQFIEEARKRCEVARDALVTIQFHVQQIA